MYQYPRDGDLVPFCIGSLKSANSVGNINIVETKSNFQADEKGLRHLRQLVYTSTSGYASRGL